MSRFVALDTLDGGISRLRNKAGAKPNEAYDMLNCYSAADGSAVSRPGTRRKVALPAGTKGMCAFGGELVVFSNAAKTIPAATPTVRCEIVPHPTNPTVEISEIHFAGPFLGHLYIVPQFADGTVRHYWLQSWGAWTANTVYLLGAVVEPTVKNGWGYKATRSGSANQLWAPNVVRAIGDRVEPTVPNGYYYEVVDVIGANPASGATEPAWPAVEDATVVEEVDGAQVQLPVDGDDLTTDPTLPQDLVDRYVNMVGKAL